MVFIKVKIHTFHMVGSLRFNMTEVQRAFLSGIKQTFFFLIRIFHYGGCLSSVSAVLLLFIWVYNPCFNLVCVCILLETGHTEFLPVGSCLLPE